MAKVVFVPGPNSHQFQKREIKVLEEVKVGRSVARCKTAPDNAIFDCKVLSRSHAVMWYQDGAVWIRDTKSSNGTFINSARLSKGGEESEPCELRSGDVIQFGVDVMETKKKDGNAVTHGCIIANATVVIPTNPPPNPDSVNPFIMQRSGMNLGTISRSASAETINCEEDTDIRDLHAVIKDALQRENLLNKRLQEVEGRLGMAIDAAELGWQALIKEDKLLARIELLESQLEIFTRDPTEYQNRIITLEEEKHKYQVHAKDSLRLICQEKSDALRQCSDLENSLTAGMIEVQHYKGLYDTTLEEQLKSEDSLRKKTVEVEEAEKVAAAALGEVKAEHEAVLEGLNTRATELEQEKTEALTASEEKERALQELVDSLQAQLLEKEVEVEAGRSAVAALKEESEGVEEVKQNLEAMRAENTLLKETNFTQEEEIMRLKEECEGLAVNTTIRDVETDAVQPVLTPSDITVATELAVLGIEMGTNTEAVMKEAAEDEDQENQMNMPNITNQRDSYRDSMSQTEKWFDAISPSSSRSDIFSSSFSANGEKRYRSLRATKIGAESPRGTTWNNSTAFEGSIAHAMALIESLDDLKSSCVKFREEQQEEYSNDEHSMIEDSVSLEHTDSLSSANSDTKISSPLRRRNSYREACEEDEEGLPEESMLGDNISETDDSQFVLAQEDHEEKPNSSVILQKGAESPAPAKSESNPDSPNRGPKPSVNKLRGWTSYMSSFWGKKDEREE